MARNAPDDRAHRGAGGGDIGHPGFLGNHSEDHRRELLERARTVHCTFAVIHYPDAVSAGLVQPVADAPAEERQIDQRVHTLGFCRDDRDR